MILLLATALAAPASFVDVTPGGAIADGAFSPFEYVGVSQGINSGFGGPVGGALLGVDSTDDLRLQFGLPGLPTDFLTIYVDSGPGGVPDTTSLNDSSDDHRAATSGIGRFNPGGRADIFFAPGFLADHAISCVGDLCVSFTLDATGLVFVEISDWNPGDLEIDVPGATLGITAKGQTFRYIATLGNPFDAAGYFRSDEFQGVAQSTVPGGNIGVGPVTLAPGDFNTFTTWCDDPEGDGVCSDVDTCPLTVDATNADGDGDGIGDVCDTCPLDVDPAQDDLDGDGVGDVCDTCYLRNGFGDADSDGICDGRLAVPLMSPATDVTLEMLNAEPGATVLFFVSPRGPGAGPCAPASLGGTCLGIRNPIELGRATADGNGSAFLTFRVPRAAAGATVSLQSIWGAGGQSETSDIVATTVAP